MKLNNKDLYNLLSEKGIHHLYHANTVGTSRTFIEQGGLMSRGAVESKGLNQTPQSSDAIDKVFDVWNDVFLDTVDLHTYFSRQNYYGPVLFKLTTDFLNEIDLDVWVTKDNPINWNVEMTDKQKYFVSVEELSENWEQYQRQRKMTTIKNNMDSILMDYVEEVIVDNPAVQITKTGLVFFNQAMADLKETLKINPPLKNKFKTRTCNGCFCRDNYLNQVSVPDLKRLFL
ncbi:hypothetical protein SAMN04489761_2491 [Tenacibaculum sp. MAR_2009_124]|uniref:hypothetical protein n=1 Tax=Tenacibaculum sp. MAR_2009_124 TaxID=1250059 RepID=UPI0008979254|nr:hypothetical protein [Tenacibaculum sp. MAR_2009_124]SEC25200.1 hypothetical protein SAMN04489761_2491 [Tenacibaculum sp. MAR_2009_124]